MVQLENLPSTGQSNDIQQRAIRNSLVLLGATALVTLVYFVLAFTINRWQMYALAGIIFTFGLVVTVALAAIKRERVKLGMWLNIGGMLLIFPIAAALVADVGFILAACLVLLLSAVSVQVLPGKQTGWAVGAGLVAGAITIFIDIVGPWERLVVPELQFFLPIITAIVLIIYGLFILRHFKSYTLRTRLIVAFLAISVLAVGLEAFFTNRLTSAALTDNAGNNLHSLANSQALNLGNLMARQLDVLESLALSRRFRDRLIQTNTSYGLNPDQIKAELLKLDQEWAAATSDDDFVVRIRLQNALSTELQAFQQTFRDHVEVFVTDQHGGLLVATTRTSDFYQADEDWWQNAYNNGLGATYISPPLYDESSDTLGVIIALPIYDDNDAVLGVLRSTYSLAPLQNLMNSAEMQAQNTHTDILFPDGQFLEAGNNEPQQIPAGILAQLNAATGSNYTEFEFGGEPSLVSQAAVTAITGEPEIAALGWRLIAHQNRDQALTPVQAQRQSTFLLAVLIAGVAVVAALLLAQLLTQPIVNLTNVAQRITSGDLAAKAQAESGDEIGTLAHAFNTMTGQLQNVIDTLEEQVLDRTRQLETVVTVSQRLSGILDLSDLMRQIVVLTKETFNYYHAHIYLLDDARRTLIMAEGYGEAGAEMKRRGHSITLSAPKSLVARAAREGRIITVENVRMDPDWLPNDLLPNTHSEMAVPIILGTEVVGVLDVQSEKIGGLTAEDESTLQALANQIATAIRNARLFSETQDALYQAQKLQRLYTEQAWERFAARQPVTHYEYRQPTQPSLDKISTPEAMAALQQGKTVSLRLSNVDNGGASHKPDNDHQKEIENTLATPLKLGEKIIGVLGIRDANPKRQWTEEEIALIEAVSEQMSLAIENARLFEQSQRNAWRDRVVSESTARVWSTAEIEEVLQAAVVQLGDTLRASEVVIRLKSETEMLPEDY